MTTLEKLVKKDKGLVTKKIIDISGMSDNELKDLCSYEGYSLSTYYRARKRGTLTVTIKN